MITITYRLNRAGNLQAAYLGSVRVGYVENRPAPRRWIWQTIFVRPEGGGYWGKEASEEDAKDALHAAAVHWTECAELRTA